MRCFYVCCLLSGLLFACDDGDDPSGPMDTTVTTDAATDADVDQALPDGSITDAALDGARPDATLTDAAVDAATDGAVPDMGGPDMGGPDMGGRDIHCDDGSLPECPMPEPDCGEGSLAAVQGGCWACVNPATCTPWGVAGCATDADCAADLFCNDCATGSCPACEDCVAGCSPHGCPTEPEAACDEDRPACGPEAVAVVADGCWTCVSRGTCEPVAACIGEGGSGAVIPDAPECCAGLAPVSCDAPDQNGMCQPCDGAFICAQCGDGVCGAGENACNCPDDCPMAPTECRQPFECLPRFWNIRCLGHWACEREQCVETCDNVGCGDGVCNQEGGESHTSCRQDCANTPECQPGERRMFTCPDAFVVPWCECGPDLGWQCLLDPGSACRDASCDDGTPPICDQIPPVCAAHELLANQDNCYRCVNPATCVPWGQAECGPQNPCPQGEICDDCGSSSCPDCDDCVAACRPGMLP